MIDLPVVIEPLPDRSGFTAQLTTPFQLSATATTAEEAHQQLAELLQRRLQQGTELRALTVPAPGGAASSWLPDDELTREWLELVRQFRDETDAADRQRLDKGPDQEDPAS